MPPAVSFAANAGQIHGGGFELGGNYTEAEAEALREATSNHKRLSKQPSKILQFVRRTIFREEEATLDEEDLDEMSSATQEPKRISRFSLGGFGELLRSTTEEHLVDGVGSSGSSGSSKRSPKLLLVLVVAATAVCVPAGMYWLEMRAQAQARAEAERAAKDSADRAFKGVTALLVICALLFVVRMLVLKQSQSAPADTDHPDKGWRRRSSMKERGTSPARLRRKNTKYHD